MASYIRYDLIYMQPTISQVELFLFDVSMSGVFAMVYGALLIVAGIIIGKKARPQSLAELRTMYHSAPRPSFSLFFVTICAWTDNG